MLVWNLVPWMWFCSMINHTSHQNSTFLWMLLPLSPLQKIVRLMEELSDSATIKFLKTYMGAGLRMSFPAHLFHQKGKYPPSYSSQDSNFTLPHAGVSLSSSPLWLLLPVSSSSPSLKVYIFGHLWFFVVIFSVCCAPICTIFLWLVEMVAITGRYHLVILGIKSTWNASL